MNNKTLLLLAGIFLFVACTGKKAEQTATDKKVIIAYVTSWTQVIPAPGEVTHINYAFGHVNDSFDGVKIDNEERLRTIAALRDQQTDLKVLLSIGGWESGRFSEMAFTESTRLSFAADCKRVVDEFMLDGIDIDWEYPGSDLAKISAAPEDVENFSKLMHDIRAAIGEDKLLTLATASTAEYYDFPGFIDAVDFVNIMSYDMGWAPYHNAALYPSEMTEYSGDESVKAHLAAGVPMEKLVYGIPFYGHFGKDMDYSIFRDSTAYRQFFDNLEKKWDDIAQVPYMVNDTGKVMYVYDDSLSVSIKSKYILEQGMLGAMFWEYASDRDGKLLQAIRNEFYKKSE